MDVLTCQMRKVHVMTKINSLLCLQYQQKKKMQINSIVTIVRTSELHELQRFICSYSLFIVHFVGSERITRVPLATLLVSTSIVFFKSIKVLSQHHQFPCLHFGCSLPHPQSFKEHANFYRAQPKVTGR